MEKCFSPFLICLCLSEVLHLSSALHGFCILQTMEGNLGLVYTSVISLPPPATSIILSYVLQKNNGASAALRSLKKPPKFSFISGEYLDRELASQDPMHTAPSAASSARNSWYNTSSWCGLTVSEVAPASPSCSCV